MTEQDQVDQLLDLCLAGDANGDEEQKLQELVGSSDELMEYYLTCIDQQLTLKQHFEDEFPQEEKVVLPQKEAAKSPLIIIAVAAILIAMLFITFNKSGQGSNTLISISPESHNFTIIRNQQELEDLSLLTLHEQDLIQVQNDGELWLKFNDGSFFFVAGGSQLLIQHSVSEEFQLLKGSISGSIKKQAKEISFLTKDSEIRLLGSRFKVKYEEKITTLSVIEGQVKLTRLRDGKSVTVPEGKMVSSTNFTSKSISDHGIKLFPTRENGVNYKYFSLSEETLAETATSSMIDSGISNRLRIQRGDHEGFVRHRPDSESHVSPKSFLIQFRSLIKIDQPGKYIFKLTAIKESRARLNHQTFYLSKEGGSTEVEFDLKKGLYPILLETIGIIEKANKAPALNLQYLVPGTDSFIDIPEKKLFYSDGSPLPIRFQDGNIDRGLSAHLPLKGNFNDLVNNLSAEPQGHPHFIEDGKAGVVCEMDGKDDALQHLPVDQLGMAREYTATAWVKLYKNKHHDQVIFANSLGMPNATLVLLIRRRHPYLAHLNNDTIADERIEYGQWHHVVFRYHEGEQSIFIDGELAVASNNHSSLFSNRPLIIGTWNHRYLKGNIKDVRIYNIALHRKDIKKLYDQTNFK